VFDVFVLTLRKHSAIAASSLNQFEVSFGRRNDDTFAFQVRVVDVESRHTQ
jgi:hypothetical protein